MAARGRAGLPTRREALAAGAAAGLSLLTGEAAAATRWVDQRRVGPFVVRASFPLGGSLLTQADLANLELELRRVLALRPCQQRLEVLLVGDAREHRRLIAERHPEAPYRRALFYKVGERSVIYAYLHREVAIDLRHECTHALLHADLPMVPLWLDEGLAEYFEPPAHLRAAGPSHLDHVLRDLDRGRLRSLRVLESKHDLAELDEVDYRYAWAWSHFLLHGPPAASQRLWNTLAALRRYEPPPSMSGELAKAVGPPEQAFAAHFRVWPGVLRSAQRGVIARD